MSQDSIIILIHGLMRTKRSMARLGSFLVKKGYQVHLYEYPSPKFTIQEHGVQLREFIEVQLKQNPGKKLSFVTHSLGGIIAREALSSLHKKHLKRCQFLIMLAPPNRGSTLAKICVELLPQISEMIKPLCELSISSDAYVHKVKTPRGVRIGVIAGKFDNKTPPKVTHLKGQHDFLVINSAHPRIMNHRAAMQAILNFLQTGLFS